jgi:hypothetical protein
MNEQKVLAGENEPKGTAAPGAAAKAPLKPLPADALILTLTFRRKAGA